MLKGTHGGVLEGNFLWPVAVTGVTTHLLQRYRSSVGLEALLCPSFGIILTRFAKLAQRTNHTLLKLGVLKACSIFCWHISGYNGSEIFFKPIFYILASV